jgi:hypothetical protein
MYQGIIKIFCHFGKKSIFPFIFNCKILFAAEFWQMLKNVFLPLIDAMLSAYGDATLSAFGDAMLSAFRLLEEQNRGV